MPGKLELEVDLDKFELLQIIFNPFKQILNATSLCIFGLDNEMLVIKCQALFGCEGKKKETLL